MSNLETIPGLTDDDRQLVRVLLANTSLQVTFNGIMTEPFQSNIGSPQGDGLSPLLFAIYLEAAIRELRASSPQRPQMDELCGLPEYAMYADDTDFISTCGKYLDEVYHLAKPVFGNLKLVINDDKKEFTTIGHTDMDVNQDWRKTKKLGSLLGVEEDVERRIQLALQSFRGLEGLWKHRSQIAGNIRIQSYQAIVESVLLYNCGTWALTVSLAERLDRAQRKMLRRILGLK